MRSRAQLDRRAPHVGPRGRPVAVGRARGSPDRQGLAVEVDPGDVIHRGLDQPARGGAQAIQVHTGDRNEVGLGDVHGVARHRLLEAVGVVDPTVAVGVGRTEPVAHPVGVAADSRGETDRPVARHEVGDDDEAGVDHSVAVVVHQVATDFLSLGVDLGIGVIAVLIVRHVAQGRGGGRGGRGEVTVAVGVGVEVPDRASQVGAITVLVDAVATDLGGAGVDGGVGVVAVIVLVVAVAIGVDGRRGADFIGSVAILVDAVATDLGGTGIHGGIGVVAVATTGRAAVDAVAVAVRIDLGPGIAEAVAATVELVALAGATVLVRDALGLAGVVDRIGLGLVDQAVAVVVDAVADELGGGRRDTPRVIVAVGVVDDVADRLRAGDDEIVWVAVAVEVHIGVPGGRAGGVLVDHAVAVVVDAVAELGGVGVDGVVPIVAVAVGHSVAVDVSVDLRLAGVDDVGIGIGIGIGIRVRVGVAIGDRIGVGIAVIGHLFSTGDRVGPVAGGEGEEGEGQDEGAGHGSLLSGLNFEPVLLGVELFDFFPWPKTAFGVEQRIKKDFI